MAWMGALLALMESGHRDATRKDPLEITASQFTPMEAQLDGKTVKFRGLEGSVYVLRPLDPSCQAINIYAPEEYFAGGKVQGWSAKTAPILFANSVGGYMPSRPGRPGSGMDGRSQTIVRALARGLVVACPGARGRTLKSKEGRFIGKAPAAIVDLKAAVRFLRHNRSRLPGDTEKIVSNGTSAGGALSSLLGASGGSQDYEPFLQAAGAAKERDDVWAVSAYCPITNLEHADMAYEWMLKGVNEARMGGPRMGPPPGAGGPPPASQPTPMSPEEVELSIALHSLFPVYLNSLNLKGSDGRAVSLDPAGNGSFKDYALGLAVASARKAAERGEDLSKTPWVTRSGGVVSLDWDLYVRSVGRMKKTPAFDKMDLSSGENSLFGAEDTDLRHFTPFSLAHSGRPDTLMADPHVVKMMNPMSYLGQKGAKNARHWRIRHGLVDRDTSLAIPAILALKASNSGLDVDLAFPWNTGHSGDYDLEELFDWIDKKARG